MVNHMRRREWFVVDETVTLYRLTNTPFSDGGQFVANEALGRPRAWPSIRAAGQGEDWVSHLGISMYDSRERAERVAEHVNGLRGAEGQVPRWTHVAVVVLDGREGFAMTVAGPRGHVTVWGSPEALASSVREGLPIRNGEP